MISRHSSDFNLTQFIGCELNESDIVDFINVVSEKCQSVLKNIDAFRMETRAIEQRASSEIQALESKKSSTQEVYKIRAQSLVRVPLTFFLLGISLYMHVCLIGI